MPSSAGQAAADEMPQDKFRLCKEETVLMLYFQVVVPALAAWFLVTQGISFRHLLLCGLWWWLQSVGVFVGNHRYFSHQSFQCSPLVKYSLAILGCLALQSGPIYWAEHHRYHHKHCDTERDIHTPKARSTFLGKLFFIHAGFLTVKNPLSHYKIIAHDLRKEKLLLLINNLNFLFHPAFGIYMWLTRGFASALWIVMVPSFLTWNGVMFTNSLCHMVGTKPFAKELGPCEATNVWWLSLICFGDNWHHNHHQRAWACNHGRGWQLDLNFALIVLLEKLGLVWNVKRTTNKKKSDH